MATLRGSAFFETMKYRYTILMIRYSVITQMSQNRGDMTFGESSSW